MNTLNRFLETIQFWEGDFLNRLISSLLIIVVLWVIRFFVLKIVYHSSSSLNLRYSWRKGSMYVLIFATLVVLGWLWFNNLQPILTFFGIIAVGITISLKEVLLNLAGVSFILWRNLFSVGDRIEINDRKGDVVGIGVFYFTLMEIGSWVDADQSTGRLVKIPNSQVITNSIVNYTKSFPYIWDEISVKLTMDSDWKKARKIIEEIAAEETEDYSQKARNHVRSSDDELIQFHRFGPKVYLEIESTNQSTITLTLRYLCEPRKRRDKENALWEAILGRTQNEPTITLA